MEKSIINVGGMSCEHCVKTVANAINVLPGVAKVKVSLKTNTATVKYDTVRISLDDIHAAIKNEEFEVL